MSSPWRKIEIKMSQPAPNPSELILYQTEDGRTRLEVRLQDQTVWLTQALLAQAY